MKKIAFGAVALLAIAFGAVDAEEPTPVTIYGFNGSVTVNGIPTDGVQLSAQRVDETEEAISKVTWDPQGWSVSVSPNAEIQFSAWFQTGPQSGHSGSVLVNGARTMMSGDPGSLIRVSLAVTNRPPVVETEDALTPVTIYGFNGSVTVNGVPTDGVQLSARRSDETGETISKVAWDPQGWSVSVSPNAEIRFNAWFQTGPQSGHSGSVLVNGARSIMSGDPGSLVRVSLAVTNQPPITEAEDVPAPVAEPSLEQQIATLRGELAAAVEALALIEADRSYWKSEAESITNNYSREEVRWTRIEWRRLGDDDWQGWETLTCAGSGCAFSGDRSADGRGWLFHLRQVPHPTLGWEEWENVNWD